MATLYDTLIPQVLQVAADQGNLLVGAVKHAEWDSQPAPTIPEDYLALWRNMLVIVKENIEVDKAVIARNDREQDDYIKELLQDSLYAAQLELCINLLVFALAYLQHGNVGAAGGAKRG